MAVRQTTLDLKRVSDFVRAWHGGLSQQAVVIPAGHEDGELAPEFKLDLVLPALGRVGPLTCQIIQRMPDGSVAARIAELPSKAARGMEKVLELIAEVKEHLVATGELVEPGAAPPVARAEAPEAPVEDAPELSELPDLSELPELPELDEIPAGEGSAAQDVAPEQAPPELPEALLDEEPGADEPAPPEHDDPAGVVRGPRGVPMPDLNGLSPTLQGVMGDTSVREALYSLSLSRAQGAFVVTALSGQTRVMYLRDGGPVGFTADPHIDDERLGALLRGSAQLPAAQLDAAEGLMSRHGLRLGEALVRAGVITHEQRVGLLQRQAELQLKRLLGTRDAEWTFTPLDRLPEPFLSPPIHSPTFLYRAVLQHAMTRPAQVILGGVKQRAKLFAIVNPNRYALIPEIAWSRPEQELLVTLRRKPERLENLVRGATAGDMRLAATILAMVETDLLILNKLPGLTQGDPEAQARRVREKAAKVGQQSAFDVMELHWICTQEAIEARFKSLLEEFDPGALPDEPTIRAENEVIVNAVKAAYAAIKAPAGRQELRAQLLDAELIQGARALLMSRGAEALAANDKLMAVEHLARLVDLAPEDPEAVAALKAALALKLK
ncbi:MAG: hypothetical protein RIT28_3724 [Pseudomonadota bacterium]